MIPLFDLTYQTRLIREDVFSIWESLVDDHKFILGPRLKCLEEQLARFSNVAYALGVNSGTDALRLSLEAIGFGPGDEVLTTPVTFPATIEPALQMGGTVTFVDIDPETGLMDLSQTSDAGSQIKAVLPVHLYGNVIDCDRLRTSLKNSSAAIIEDACQAFGSSFQGRPVGSLGDIGCFSFYPTKNLSAMGDAGALTTGNAEFSKRMEALRDHGRVNGEYIPVVGYNSRLDEIQAAVLLAKLKHFKTFAKEKARLAEVYHARISEIPEIRTPKATAGAKPLWSLMTILTDRREKLFTFLKQKNIASGIYYPQPLHKNPAFQNRIRNLGSLTLAETWCQSCLSLPFFNGLSEDAVHQVCDAIRDFFKS